MDDGVEKSKSLPPGSNLAVDDLLFGPAGNRLTGHSVHEATRDRCVDVVRWDQLRPAQRVAWQRLRASRAEFDSPFFSLEFADAVHATRQDVWVAVIRRAQSEIGFLAFHRIGGVAYPVGRIFNDAHHVIADRATDIDWLWLLEQCGVKAFAFHSLVGATDQFQARYAQRTIASFCANLGDDSQQFLQQLGQQHRTIRRQPQKTRKLAREVGPVSLQVDCRDPDLLAQTIGWKRAQYQRTNILDLFTPQWTRDLLAVMHASTSGARGMLSVLRAGDRVIAAHFGIREGDLLHYWFPCYDTDYRQYSPGTALFTELVRQASSVGIRRIDMGYGEQPYKRKQTDTITSVAYGCVSRSRLYRGWHRVSDATSILIKRVPMKEPLKRALRSIKPTAGISRLD
jgi:CelD/BcsL family acetyltransferase involved in cellulose biosynthesis